MAYHQIQNCLQIIHFYFSVINSVDTFGNELTDYLHKFNWWDFQCNKSLNQDTIKQAKEITFSRKTEKIFHPSLRFNNNIVSQTPY